MSFRATALDVARNNFSRPGAERRRDGNIMPRELARGLVFSGQMKTMAQKMLFG